MPSVPVRFLSIRMPRQKMLAAQSLAMALMLLSILGLGGASAAAQGTVIRQTTTTSANAQGEVCFEEFVDCSFVNLSIGPGKVEGTNVLCLSISTGAELYEHACTDVTATFSIDANVLTFADQLTTPVTFETANCDKSGNCSDPVIRTVNLSANWVGDGDLIPIQEMLGDPHGPCTEMHVINGFVRDSSVTLTIDGQAVNAYGNLQSLDAKQTLRTNCG